MRRALTLDDVKEDDGEYQSSIRDEEEQYQQYQQFIQTELTPQTQRVFRMHYGERLKYREIAEQVGISEAAVYKHLSQAINKLKNRFNP
jgi:RNA polymerase sigma-70 factor (ECF subfamily)